MNNNAENAVAEVNDQVETPVVETTKVETPEVKVQVLTIPEVAAAIVKANPELVIHENEATGYKCLITAEKTDLNWKKGLIWNVNCFSKGFNFEFQLYSSKKGAHLVEFVDRFKALANDKIKAENMGLTIRLRIKLPMSLGLDEIVKQATDLIKLVEPVANEVRALLKDEDFVSKKETSKAKKVEEQPKAEDPAKVEEPAVEAPAAEAEVPVTQPKIVEKAAKKSKK